MSEKRLRMIYGWQTMRRIRIRRVNGYEFVTVDVHGLKCSEAETLINNVINIIHKAFHLIVIHGYRSGTAIRDMLSQTFENPHISEKYPDERNLGMTHIVCV